ncbi:MAG TPA: hypothetical protein VJU15_09215, partial [Gemmatimonadales bacterium]|nr:hypothetical protein [Gemmatimonadales bacterium]
TRRTAGSVIVGSWVCCIGWAVARQVTRPPEAYLEERKTRLAPGAAFYQITLGEMPMGNAGITLDTTLAGYRVTEVWNMDLARDRDVERHVFRSDAELSRSLLLRKLSFTMSEAGNPRFLEAEAANDTTWNVTLRRPGTRAVALSSIDAPTNASAPVALPLRLVLEGRLREGGSTSLPVVAVMYGTLDHDSAVVTRDSIFSVADSAAWDSTASTWTPVAARAVQAWRVERTVHGFPSLDWIDAQGRLIQRDWAFGLRLTRSPFEVNYNMYQTRLRQGELKPPARVPGSISRRLLPGLPDSTKQVFVARLARGDGPAWNGAVRAFEGGRQAVNGDTVTIRAEPVPDSLAVLVHRAARLGRDPVGVFVDLANARGHTTRRVSGVDLARPELPSHTWVEVQDGPRWLAVDPAYGQAPASVSLLRVVVGGSDRPLILVPLIGSLQSTTLVTQ